MVLSDLDIYGRLKPRVEDRVRQFWAELASSTWGRPDRGRLVIARDYKAALRKFLSEREFRDWSEMESVRQGHGEGIGMGFIAADEVPTAVVREFSVGEEGPELFEVCCHELAELSVAPPTRKRYANADESMQTLIWSEHVVERLRTHIFVQKGWSDSAASESLNSLSDQYAGDFQALISWAVKANAVPDRTYWYWQILVREAVSTFGRARGGSGPDADEWDRFVSTRDDGSSSGWLKVASVCDEAFQSGGSSLEDLDARGLEAWHGVLDAFSTQWNHAYRCEVRRKSGPMGWAA